MGEFGQGRGVGLAKYSMYDGQCENGESVLMLNKGEVVLFISLSQFKLKSAFI